MAGRKEAEQRRPSQIKGARIKELVCFSFPPLTGWRGGEGEVGGRDGCMLRRWRTSLTNSPSLSQLHCIAALQRALPALATRAVSAHLAQHHLFIRST